MEAKLTDKKTLNILNYLLKNKASKKELLDCFSIKPSTLYRHINLINEAGFDVEFLDSVYRILTYKNLITFAKYELDLLSYLMLLGYIMLPDKEIRKLKNAINKILSLTNKKDAYFVKENYEKYRLSSINKCYSEKISAFKKYQIEKKHAAVITRNNEELNMLPIEFSWDKNKLFLKYLDEENVQKTILVDDIIKIFEEKNELKFSNNQETIFELYGRLSKSYLLKEEEKIVDFTRDKIVVANYSKDKVALFKRLLKYDVLCKVIFPKTDVKEFKNIIEESLANIDKILDNI